MARVTSSSSARFGTAGNYFSQYNEVTGVAMGASQTVLTYTVPPGSTFTLTQIVYSGDSIATVEISIDGDTTNKGRITYTEYNGLFSFANYPIPENVTLNIVATNFSLQGAGSFNATLQGVLS